MGGLNVLAKVCWILLVPFVVTLPLNPRIINGTLAITENTRHQVSVRDKRGESIMFGYGHICGGSLIAPSVVLSAAHCFFDAKSGGFFSEQQFLVVMGTLNRFEKNENTISLDIDHIVYADYIRPKFQNDLALLFLTGKVPATNPDIRIIPLNKDVIHVGTVCQFNGWGHSEYSTITILLETLDVPIIDKNICSNNYGKYVITDRMICAGYLEGERGVCQGDSGGALVSQGKQVGIASFIGGGCAAKGFPGVYTDVRHYVDWIEETIKANSTDSL